MPTTKPSAPKTTRSPADADAIKERAECVTRHRSVAATSDKMQALHDRLRTGRRTFVACAAMYSQYESSLLRDTPDSIVAAVVEDMLGDADGDDLTVWELLRRGGCRLIAVVRPGTDGTPVVTRFDGKAGKGGRS